MLYHRLLVLRQDKQLYQWNLTLSKANKETCWYFNNLLKVFAYWMHISKMLNDDFFSVLWKCTAYLYINAREQWVWDPEQWFLRMAPTKENILQSCLQLCGFGLLLPYFSEDAKFIHQVFVPAPLSQVGTFSSMFMVTCWWTSGKKLIGHEFGLSYLTQSWEGVPSLD